MITVGFWEPEREPIKLLFEGKRTEAEELLKKNVKAYNPGMLELLEKNRQKRKEEEKKAAEARKKQEEKERKKAEISKEKREIVRYRLVQAYESQFGTVLIQYPKIGEQIP